MVCKLPHVNLSCETTGIHTCIQQSLVNLFYVSLHGVVNIFSRKDLPTRAKEQTTSLVCTSTPLILRFMRVLQRQKGSDCGVFALTFATTLLRMLGGCLYSAQRGTIYPRL